MKNRVSGRTRKPSEERESTDVVANVLQLPLAQEPVHGARVGRLCGINAERRPLVTYEGQVGGPVPAARTTIALDEQTVVEATESGREVLLMFVDGAPVIVGLLQDAAVAPRVPRRESRDVRLEGDRVVLKGKREIVLETERGRITVRRNGVVQVEGMQVETRARGLHRIKGARVEVN